MYGMLQVEMCFVTLKMYFKIVINMDELPRIVLKC